MFSFFVILENVYLLFSVHLHVCRIAIVNNANETLNTNYSQLLHVEFKKYYWTLSLWLYFVVIRLGSRPDQ